MLLIRVEILLFGAVASFVKDTGEGDPELHRASYMVSSDFRCLNNIGIKIVFNVFNLQRQRQPVGLCGIQKMPARSPNSSAGCRDRNSPLCAQGSQTIY